MSEPGKPPSLATSSAVSDAGEPPALQPQQPIRPPHILPKFHPQFRNMGPRPLPQFRAVLPPVQRGFSQQNHVPFSMPKRPPLEIPAMAQRQNQAFTQQMQVPYNEIRPAPQQKPQEPQEEDDDVRIIEDNGKEEKKEEKKEKDPLLAEFERVGQKKKEKEKEEEEKEEEDGMMEEPPVLDRGDGEDENSEDLLDPFVTAKSSAFLKESVDYTIQRMEINRTRSRAGLQRNEVDGFSIEEADYDLTFMNKPAKKRGSRGGGRGRGGRGKGKSRISRGQKRNQKEQEEEEDNLQEENMDYMDDRNEEAREVQMEEESPGEGRRKKRRKMTEAEKLKSMDMGPKWEEEIVISARRRSTLEARDEKESPKTRPRRSTRPSGEYYNYEEMEGMEYEEEVPKRKEPKAVGSTDISPEVRKNGICTTCKERIPSTSRFPQYCSMVCKRNFLVVNSSNDQKKGNSANVDKTQQQRDDDHEESTEMKSQGPVERENHEKEVKAQEAVEDDPMESDDMHKQNSSSSNDEEKEENETSGTQEPHSTPTTSSQPVHDPSPVEFRTKMPIHPTNSISPRPRPPTVSKQLPPVPPIPRRKSNDRTGSALMAALEATPSPTSTPVPESSTSSNPPSLQPISPLPTTSSNDLPPVLRVASPPILTPAPVASTSSTDSHSTASSPAPLPPPSAAPSIAETPKAAEDIDENDLEYWDVKKTAEWAANLSSRRNYVKRQLLGGDIDGMVLYNCIIKNGGQLKDKLNIIFGVLIPIKKGLQMLTRTRKPVDGKRFHFDSDPEEFKTVEGAAAFVRKITSIPMADIIRSQAIDGIILAHMTVDELIDCANITYGSALRIVKAMEDNQMAARFPLSDLPLNDVDEIHSWSQESFVKFLKGFLTEEEVNILLSVNLDMNMMFHLKIQDMVDILKIRAGPAKKIALTMELIRHNGGVPSDNLIDREAKPPSSPSMTDVLRILSTRHRNLLTSAQMENLKKENIESGMLFYLTMSDLVNYFDIPFRSAKIIIMQIESFKENGWKLSASDFQPMNKVDAGKLQEKLAEEVDSWIEEFCTPQGLQIIRELGIDNSVLHLLTVENLTKAGLQFNESKRIVISLMNISAPSDDSPLCEEINYPTDEQIWSWLDQVTPEYAMEQLRESELKPVYFNLLKPFELTNYVKLKFGDALKLAERLRDIRQPIYSVPKLIDKPIEEWDKKEVRQWVAKIADEPTASQISQLEIDGNAISMISIEDVLGEGIKFGHAKAIVANVQQHVPRQFLH